MGQIDKQENALHVANLHPSAHICFIAPRDLFKHDSRDVLCHRPLQTAQKKNITYKKCEYNTLV
jgi:hypothetical protein